MSRTTFRNKIERLIVARSTEGIFLAKTINITWYLVVYLLFSHSFSFINHIPRRTLFTQRYLEPSNPVCDEWSPDLQKNVQSEKRDNTVDNCDVGINVILETTVKLNPVCFPYENNRYFWKDATLADQRCNSSDNKLNINL